MVWGELGMLYFCISNEDLKNQRFENTCCVLQTCNEKGCSFKRTTFYVN